MTDSLLLSRLEKKQVGQSGGAGGENTTFEINGANLEITDGGGTLSVALEDLVSGGVGAGALVFEINSTNLRITSGLNNYDVPTADIVSDGGGVISTFDILGGNVRIIQGSTTLPLATVGIVADGGGHNTSLSLNGATDDIELVDGDGTLTVNKYEIVSGGAYRFSFGSLPLSPDVLLVGAPYYYKLYSALNPYVWFNNGGDAAYRRTATGPLIFPVEFSPPFGGAATYASLQNGTVNGGLLLRHWEVEVEWENFLSGSTPANKVWASIPDETNNRAPPYVGIKTNVTFILLNDLNEYVADVEAVNDDIRADIDETTLFTGATSFPTPFNLPYVAGTGVLANYVKMKLKLNNNGTESGAWTEYGGPSTLTTYNLIKNNNTVDTDSQTLRPDGIFGWWGIGTNIPSSNFGATNPQMQFLGGTAILRAFHSDVLSDYADATWSFDVQGEWLNGPLLTIQGDMGPILPSDVTASPVQFVMEVSYSTRTYVPVNYLNSRYFPSVSNSGDTKALIP